MRLTKVRILKCKEPAAWYAKLTGHTFDVYDDRKVFLLKEDYDRGHDAIWRYIAKEDCEEVE